MCAEFPNILSMVLTISLVVTGLGVSENVDIWKEGWKLNRLGNTRENSGTCLLTQNQKYIQEGEIK